MITVTNLRDSFTSSKKNIIMDALLISLIVFYVILAIFAICAVAAFSLHQEGSPGLEQDIELQERPVI